MSAKNKKSIMSAIPSYDGYFVSGNGWLPNDLFDLVLGLLGPVDLVRAEGVCRSWKHFIHESNQWKKQCQGLMNTRMDPKAYLPLGLRSHKENCQLLFSRVLGEISIDIT